jgi:hypothetical protein
LCHRIIGVIDGMFPKRGGVPAKRVLQRRGGTTQAAPPKITMAIDTDEHTSISFFGVNALVKAECRLVSPSDAAVQ